MFSLLIFKYSVDKIIKVLKMEKKYKIYQNKGPQESLAPWDLIKNLPGGCRKGDANTWN